MSKEDTPKLVANSEEYEPNYVLTPAQVRVVRELNRWNAKAFLEIFLECLAADAGLKFTEEYSVEVAKGRYILTSK